MQIQNTSGFKYTKLVLSFFLSGFLLALLMGSTGSNCDNPGNFGPNATDINGDGDIDENDDYNDDGVIDGIDEKIVDAFGIDAFDVNDDGEINEDDDLNGDGKIDNTDNLVLVFGEDVFDVNGDGFIDSSDDINDDGIIDQADAELFNNGTGTDTGTGTGTDSGTPPAVIPDTPPRTALTTGHSTSPVSIGSEGSNAADTGVFGTTGDSIVCAVENIGPGSSLTAVANLTDNSTLATFQFDFGNGCDFVETSDGTDCVIIFGGITSSASDGLIIGCDDGTGAPDDVTTLMPNTELFDVFTPRDETHSFCTVDDGNNEVTCFSHNSPGSAGFAADPAESFDAAFFNGCSSGNSPVSAQEDNNGFFLFLMSNGELAIGQPGDSSCSIAATIPTGGGTPFDMTCADNPDGTNSNVCGVVINGTATNNFVIFTIVDSSSPGGPPTISVNSSAESVGQSPVRADAEVIMGTATFVVSSFGDDVFHQIKTDGSGNVTSNNTVPLTPFCASGATNFLSQDDLDGGTQQALVGCSSGGFDIIDLP